MRIPNPSASAVSRRTTVHGPNGGVSSLGANRSAQFGHCNSVVLGFLLAYLIGMALNTASASAAITHPLIKTFGSFNYPSGIGVDESSGATRGNVIVAESRGGNLVHILGPLGGLPSGVVPPNQIEGFNFHEEPSGVAIDNSTSPADPSRGDLYVTDVRNNAVKKFRLNPITEEYELLESLNATPPLYEPLGVAIDSKGDVYVANFRPSAIVEFGPTGVELGRSARGEREEEVPSGLAFDSAGDLFVQDFVSGKVEKLTLNGSGQVSGEESIATGATGIAIDPVTDTLYLASHQHIAEWGPATGKPELEGEFSGYHSLGGTSRIAVNAETHDIYVTDRANGDVAVFGPSVIIPTVTTGPATVNRTTAILSGEVDQAGGDEISECKFEYVPHGDSFADSEVLKTVPCDQSTPLTGHQTVSAEVTHLHDTEMYDYRLVAGSDLGYTEGKTETLTAGTAVSELTTDPATAVQLESATLNGSMNSSDLETTYSFQYGVSSEYGQATALQNAALGSTKSPVAGVEINGLEPNQTYHYRIVATNEFGTTYGQDETFETPSTPSIDGLSSEDVTATSAVLIAKVNPHGLDHSFATTCHFEYGPTSSYGADVPCPAPQPLVGTTDQVVEVELTGLQAITYHFRLVTENEWGNSISEDQTFSFYPPVCPNSHVRQETGSDSLPDCRAYELVSPSNQGGLIMFPGSAPPTPFATNPARFAFGGGFGQIPGTDPPNGLGIDSYLATRTDNGWVTKYVGLQGNEVLGVEMWGDLSFDKIINFNLSNFCFFECPSVPVPRAPYEFDSEGNSLGRWPASIGTNVEADLHDRGAWQPSPDFTHLAFSSNNYDFGENGEVGLTSAPGSAYDYDTSTQSTKVISHLANGTSIPQDATNTNGGEYINFPGDNNASESEAFPARLYPSVSNDGSHILMSVDSTTPACGNGCSHGPAHLYMRVNDSLTYEVSLGDDGTNHAVNYVGMTSDGTKVFFTSNEPLTPDDTDHSTDLYMWSLGSDGVATVTRVSTANNGGGNTDACSPAGGWTSACDIVPVGPGRSSVGDSAIAHESGDIYFYSPEQLVGSKGIPNQENLYLFRGGAVQYVMTFSPGQDCEPGEEGTCGNGPIGRMDVSPNGDHMAFITNQQMTGYDSQGFDEMYSFNPVTGDTVCVSCNPSGAPPVGSVTGADDGLFMSDDGRTFFYTPDSLVAQDTNELHDVYEYVEGRPQLISAGTGSEDIQQTGNQTRSVGLAGVSADGVNVYFSTFDTLVGQDHNGPFAKYYDARTNGGFPSPPGYAPCDAADECHGAGSIPPGSIAIGSNAALGAAGNVKPGLSPRQRGRRRKKVHRHGRRAGRRGRSS